MPISGWIMVGWFWLVIVTGIGLLVWGWRSGRLQEWEEAKYIVLEEPGRGPESAEVPRESRSHGPSRRRRHRR